MTTHRVTAGRDGGRSHPVSGGDNSKLSDLGKSDSPDCQELHESFLTENQKSNKKIRIKMTNWSVFKTAGLTLTFLLSFTFSTLEAQFNRQSMDSIRRVTFSDYKNMLDQLQIDSTRRGPSGTPTAPNAANTDESKATPYRSLPDPLILNGGKPVKNAKIWWKKRMPEIVELFDREIYGRVPENLPAVKWELVSTKTDTVGGIPVRTKNLLGHLDNSSFPSVSVDIQFSVSTPVSAQAVVPVIMEFGFNFPARFRMPDPPAGRPRDPDWKELLVKKGWGYAILVPTSFQADNGAGLTQGIIGFANRGKYRSPEDWGTLRAWAWGASRALDYLETDPDVDSKRVGIEGLSRYGKAAVVAMAYEPRFAIGFIGSSGAGGAKILRRVLGEQVENLAASGEYHWFAGNFIKYAGPLTPLDLPVDAHELIAMCAPRPVFISCGAPNVEGQWVDARGTFLAGVFAEPVYALLGKKGMGTTTFPPLGTGLLDGEIAFRQHEGGHTTGPNWPYFINYAEKYFK
jgi:hypothetical protein